MVPPSIKLNDLIRLAELCVDLLQQNEEHYAEVSYALKLTTMMAMTCDVRFIYYFLLLCVLSVRMRPIAF